MCWAAWQALGTAGVSVLLFVWELWAAGFALVPSISTCLWALLHMMLPLLVLPLLYLAEVVDRWVQEAAREVLQIALVAVLPALALYALGRLLRLLSRIAFGDDGKVLPSANDVCLPALPQQQHVLALSAASSAIWGSLRMISSVILIVCTAACRCPPSLSCTSAAILCRQLALASLLPEQPSPRRKSKGL
jgi:hypothetical protein